MQLLKWFRKTTYIYLENTKANVTKFYQLVNLGKGDIRAFSVFFLQLFHKFEIIFK